MSTERGNGSRTRAQKYKNRHVFKNDLHDKTPQQKKINSLHVSEVCQHCKQVIEWKIKYKKYKPLTKPKTCVKCQERNIRKAYHVLCRGCALSQKVCAKCLKTAEEVNIEPPLPSPEEELKLKVEMQRLIKSFPERKRRAFLRYMQKGKVEEVPDEGNENDDEDNEEGEEDGNAEKEKPAMRRIPHSREALLKKIEELKIGDDNDFSDFDDSDGDEEDEDDYNDESEDDQQSNEEQTNYRKGFK